MKRHDEPAFHLYEINLDGTGLRQITDGPYDDLDPIYLPDGRLMFSSTRGNTFIRCMPYTYSYILARCDADGRNLYLLSAESEPEWLPTLLNDGRVIFSRWDYIDKALWRIQSLWTTRQDGTQVETFWGNQSVWPDHLAEARPIPGSDRVMFTGVAHHDWFAGSIGILDPSQGRNFPHGLTKVTADVAWPECGTPPQDPIEAADYHSAGKFDAYQTPYPLSEEDFLVSARRDGKFRLYLMDVHGNRELIYEGAHHIWHAMPVKPRVAPPRHSDLVAWPGTGPDRRPAEPGVFYSANVTQGVPDLPPRKSEVPPRASDGPQDLLALGPRRPVLRPRRVAAAGRRRQTHPRHGAGRGGRLGLLQGAAGRGALLPAPRRTPARVAHDAFLDRAPAGRTPELRRLPRATHDRAGERDRAGAAARAARTDAAAVGHGQRRLRAARATGAGSLLRQMPLRRGGGPGETQSRAAPRRRRVQGAVSHADRPHRFRLNNKPHPRGLAGALMCENFEQSDPASYATLRPMQHLVLHESAD